MLSHAIRALANLYLRPGRIGSFVAGPDAAGDLLRAAGVRLASPAIPAAKDAPAHTACAAC